MRLGDSVFQCPGFFQLVTHLEQAFGRIPAVGTEGGGIEGGMLLRFFRDTLFQQAFPHGNAFAAMLGNVGQASFS